MSRPAKEKPKQCPATSVLGRCELEAGHEGYHVNAGDGWPGPVAPPKPHKPRRRP